MQASHELDLATTDSEPDADEGARRSVSDQPAAVDLIGFDIYVRSVAEFLVNPDTEPPLTMSIEGSWGSGKSSFMKQLLETLKADGRKVVWFNAWRHDKVDSLYAAFALDFLKQVRKMTPLPQRLLAGAKLWWDRFRLENGKLALLQVVVLWLFLVSAAWFGVWHGVPALIEKLRAVEDIKPTQSNISLPISSYAAFFFAVLLLFERLNKITDPLEKRLRELSRAPDYEKQVDLIERFHLDFARILHAYLGTPFARPEDKRKTGRTSAPPNSGPRVFVFIDDLDRCEIPKSADLIQGLNLMISDSPHIVFILGIDREKTAAALAVKYEKFLPYFPVLREVRSLSKPSSNGACQSEPHSFDPTDGLEFGYSFLEKFIQVGFQVPRMADDRVGKFFEAMESKGPPPKGTPATTISKSAPDTGDVLKIAQDVAQFLDYNPRRLKQFLNVFRLRRFIAFHTERLKAFEQEPPDPPRDTPVDKTDELTLEQLAKFVVISLRWPGLLPDLLADEELLADLEMAAFGLEPRPERKAMNEVVANLKRFDAWRARPNLSRLLKFRCDKDGRPLKWSLRWLRLRALLEISPNQIAVKRLRQSPKTPRGEPVSPSVKPPVGDSATLNESPATDSLEMSAQKRPNDEDEASAQDSRVSK